MGMHVLLFLKKWGGTPVCEWLWLWLWCMCMCMWVGVGGVGGYPYGGGGVRRPDFVAFCFVIH